MARAVPYAYRDFDAPADEPVEPAIVEAPAPCFTSLDVDAAYASGLEKGAAEANSAHRDEHDALTREYAANIAKLGAAFEARRAEDAKRLRAEIEAALVLFLRRIHRASALDNALDLVDRLLAASADRSAVTLRIADQSLAETICSELAARNAKDFIRVELDGSLAAGDCRLEWRGGAAARRFSTLRAELRRLLHQPAAAAANEE